MDENLDSKSEEQNNSYEYGQQPQDAKQEESTIDFSKEQQTHHSQQEERETNQTQYSYGNHQYRYYTDSDPNHPYEKQEEDTSVMGVGDWIVTLLVMLIPFVGIVIYFVWAFGKNTNVNRRNYCRAYLIYWAITSVILGILIIAMSAFFVSSGGYYYS